MNRKDIINFVNDDILTQVKYDRLTIPVKELLQIVIKYRSDCIKSGTAKSTMTAEVKNGFLYIDQKPIKRIALLDPRSQWDEYSYHIEGKILARQETKYDY